MNQEEREAELQAKLSGQPLTDLEFYAVNPRYFSPDPERTWILSGAIELTFGETVFTFGWNEEKEFFDAEYRSFSEMLHSLPSEPLEAKNVETLHKLIGQSITGITCQWNFYQEYDEDFNLSEEKKYMPKEMVLTFEDGSTLQLATVAYEMLENAVGDMIFDSQAQLLISLNKRFEIGEHQAEV